MKAMKTVEEITDKAEVFVIEKNYIHSGLADRPRIISWIAEFAVAHANDAVADEKARLLKRYRARIKRLRADDAETHRIQIEVKDDRIEAERAKNAALVAAAELVIKRNWERINGDGSDYSLFSQAIGNLGDAIAANENGGAND